MNPADVISHAGAEFGAAVSDAVGHMAAVLRFRPFVNLTSAEISAILEDAPNA